MLRGFTAFDIFLEQHPEFRERVTFIAQLQPSRPGRARSTPSTWRRSRRWSRSSTTATGRPTGCRSTSLRDDFEEAVAAYKHFDVLLVNAMLDGMNLVAKEGPLVNERNGVSILSENTGAHEELGECALSVNPFDVQEHADAIYAALTMSAEERERRRRASRRS